MRSDHPNKQHAISDHDRRVQYYPCGIFPNLLRTSPFGPILPASPSAFLEWGLEHFPQLTVTWYSVFLRSGIYLALTAYTSRMKGTCTAPQKPRPSSRNFLFRQQRGQQGGITTFSFRKAKKRLTSVDRYDAQSGLRIQGANVSNPCTLVGWVGFILKALHGYISRFSQAQFYPLASYKPRALPFSSFLSTTPHSRTIMAPPPNHVYTAFSFIGFLLSVIPFYWHLEGTWIVVTWMEYTF